MSEDTTPIRVALIGLGWVTTQVWLPMLAEHPGFTVTDIVDSDTVALDKVAGLVPDARAATVADGISPSDVDIAVVAVPNHLHATVASALLRRGVAVFVEKPVCLTSEEAAMVIEAERSAGGRVLAGSAAWHRMDVKALRAALDQVGAVRSVELSWVRGKGVPTPGSWITNRELAGGGVLFDLGWHLVNLGMRLLGWPAVTDVLGTVSGDFIGRDGFAAAWRDGTPAADGADVEDTAHGRARTEDGTLFSVTAAWASHTRPDRTRIVVDGALGRLELTCTFGFSPDRVESELLLWKDGERTLIDVPQEEVGAEYRRQLDLLPLLLADPGQPGAATAEAAGTVAIIERIYESARSRPAAH